MSSPIVVWPDPVLTHPTAPVTDFGPDLESLLARMLEAVVAAEGIGIAANQIGVPARVALVGREDGTFFEIVNPEILEREVPVSLREGCLSIPEQFEEVPRFARVKVRFQDRHGQAREELAEGRLAHVFQHEIDHLNGTVFADHLSSLKRGLLRSKMQKVKRSRS